MRTRIAGHAHIDDVVGLEVYLRRAARALKHHHVSFGRKAAVGAAHGLPCLGFVAQVGSHAHLPHRLAQHNHLRPGVRSGFEQYRIHAYIGGQAAGSGLKGLGAAHLLTVMSDKRIKGHVLCLERHNPEATPGQKTAQGRREQAFARIGTGSLQHEGRGQAVRSRYRTY